MLMHTIAKLTCGLLIEMKNNLSYLMSSIELTPTVSAPFYCAPGWQRLAGRCYIVSKEAVAWPLARTNCRALGLGADLVKVPNGEVNHLVYNSMYLSSIDLSQRKQKYNKKK